MTTVVVDPSAVVAILFNEPDLALYDRLIVATTSLISVGSKIELGVVTRRKMGATGLRRALVLLEQYEIEPVAVDPQQADVALAAFDRFGKGRGAPPAVLNYGDLFSYALAKSRDLPLLYKGDDFTQTDVRSAVLELAE